MTHCSRTMILTMALLGIAATVSQAQSAPNPACGLLSAADLKKITGKAYDEGDQGDAQGRISEMYWNYDVFGLLQQLGAIPAPGQQPVGVSA